MFITNKHLDRRTFLRGMGATVALPLLDAMIPARTLLAFAGARPATRLAFIYFPLGAIMDEWDGRILQPLAPFRDRLTVVGGIENRHAYGPVHAITPGTWLSGIPASERGITVDQLAANHFACETVLPSIAVATEQPPRISAGIWEGQYDPGFSTTISRAAGPIPMEYRPRAVFDLLFQRVAGPANVLDLVADEAASLRKQLGSADRSRLKEYLETVRDVERRVDQADTASFADRMALMFDLIALAFRADITRVAAMMMAAETSSQTYDNLGVADSFHELSHHQNDPEKIEQLVRIQTFHTSVFASFIQTLATQRDGDGSILDRSLILYGSNMSNSYAHDHFPLPLAVVGGAPGWRHGGRRLNYPDRTPIVKLLRTLLYRADVAFVEDSEAQAD
jgi:hypothetical protein